VESARPSSTAARKAAHTRGARHLYLLSSDAGSFFERQGFVRVEVADVIAALSGVPQVEHYRTRPTNSRAKSHIIWTSQATE